jgi:hypothetical protein
MNRLTKHISLVLISSSLILHGCEQPRDKEEQKDKNSPTSSTGGGHSSYTGGSHYIPFVHSSGYGASGISSGRSGAVSSFSRGGFGSSAHGVSS